jgi:enoyl-CoA hydratase/carnithine racemase
MRAGRHGLGRRAGASLMPAINWEVRDGIAVVTLNKPDSPVNVISQSVKDEVYAMLTALERDARVRGVAFFSGKTNNFIAGADIEEFACSRP